MPLSASLPVAGANADLGFVVRCQADGLSSVGVNEGLGKRGLTLSLPGERVPGSRVGVLGGHLSGMDATLRSSIQGRCPGCEGRGRGVQAGKLLVHCSSSPSAGQEGD